MEVLGDFTHQSHPSPTHPQQTRQKQREPSSWSQLQWWQTYIRSSRLLPSWKAPLFFWAITAADWNSLPEAVITILTGVLTKKHPKKTNPVKHFWVFNVAAFPAQAAVKSSRSVSRSHDFSHKRGSSTHLSTETMIKKKHQTRMWRQISTTSKRFEITSSHQSCKGQRSDSSTEFREVELWCFKEQWTLNLLGRLVCFVQQLEDACAKIHRNAHDDALTHTCSQWDKKQKHLDNSLLKKEKEKRKSYMFWSHFACVCVVHCNFEKSSITKSHIATTKIPIIQENRAKKDSPSQGWSVVKASTKSFAFYFSFFFSTLLIPWIQLQKQQEQQLKGIYWCFSLYQLCCNEEY